MIKIKQIDDYIKLTKKIPVSVEIHKLINNIVKPLLASDVFFDRKTFNDCIEYCETWYYPLFPYQKFIYALFFLYTDDSKKKTCFDEFFLMMGRGNGKDGMMAPLADFMTTPLHGISKYNVEIIANSEKQSKGTYEIIYDRMTKYSNEVDGYFKVSIEETKNIETGSIVGFNSGNPKTGDGRRPGMIIVNEVHEMENYNLISVYQSARGKVDNPRTVYITTDGGVRGAVLDDFKDFSKKVLNGDVPGSRWCPIIFKLDNEEEVDEPEMWPKSNPSMPYRDILKNEIYETYIKMKHQPHLEFDFYVKRMNLPKENEEKLFTAWENVLATNREIPDNNGSFAIFALDYAEIKDFASCGFLTKVGNEYIWEQHSWVNKRSKNFKFIKPPLNEWENKGLLTIVDTPTIDIELIWNYFFEKCINYNTLIIVIDTFRYGLVKASAERRGFSMQDPKTNPSGEIFLVRSGEITDNILVPQMEEIFAYNKIIFGDDPLMRWYTNNTGVEQTKKGNKNFIKIEPKLRKNDGFQALRHAFVKADLLDQSYSWTPLI